MPEQINENYLGLMKGIAAKESPIFVDDSDVIKPYGKSFEALGRVRDGSSPDSRLEKGYIVTEAVALSAGTKQPFSVFSRIHSSAQKDWTSTNDVTFEALEQAFRYYSDSTYVFDRGYDMNRLFTFMHEKGKHFIIRLTEKRKLFHKGKWFKATTLRDSRKGKIKSHIMFGGKKTECWISCVNVQITESRNWIKLILVYGLSEQPMMLATNRPIKSKEDAVKAVRLYFMRWRIEEYFRFKKQHLGFEGFRVRSLKAMNNLNCFLSIAIGMMCALAEKQQTSRLRIAVMQHANGQRQEEQIAFLLYRIGLGMKRILAKAHSGIRAWFRIGRPKYVQLSFPLLC